MQALAATAAPSWVPSSPRSPALLSTVMSFLPDSAVVRSLFSKLRLSSLVVLPCLPKGCPD